jgi:DNA-binding NtrC family response regulator
VQDRSYPARILLVDDEPALATVMAQYLSRLGYDVAEYHSGKEAWAAFEAAPGSFDLIVADLTLPDVSGQELLTRMTARNPTLAVIASSGYPVDSATLPGAWPQRAAFLPKPFMPGMLAEVVGRLLSDRPRSGC